MKKIIYKVLTIFIAGVVIGVVIMICSSAAIFYGVHKPIGTEPVQTVPAAVEPVITPTATPEPTPEPTPMVTPEPTPEPTPEAERIYKGVYTIFSYCPCVKCCGKSDGITASGVAAVEGVTIATGGEFPFGTRLYIEGVGERIVQDRGVGNGQIDLFKQSHTECLRFGIKYLNVWEVK